MSVRGHSAGHGFNDFVAGVPRLVRQSFARPEQICRAAERADPLMLSRVFAEWQPNGQIDGRFIKATKANGHVIKANGRFIKANGRFIKADGRFIKGSFDALQGQVRVWDLGFRVIEYCFAYSVPAGTVPREGRPLGQLHSCWRFIGNSLDLLPGR